MNLPDNIVKQLQNKEWYHQRFDGSPLFISTIAEAEVIQEERKPAGTEADLRVCYFDDGKADWYLDMGDVKRGADAIIEMAKKDSETGQHLLDAWKEDEQAFEAFFNSEFSTSDLDSLSDSELIDLWNRYWTLFQNRTTSSAVIDHFALGTDEQISQMLRKEVGKVEKESEFTHIFSVATAPVHLSFINQAEIDLLKIAAGQSDMTLKEYAQEYYWTKNNYVLAQELTVEHFEEEIQAWKESGKDLEKEITAIQATPGKNLKEKQELFSQYEFSPLLLTLLKISEDFTWWQDERKKATYLNIDMGVKLLEQISKRSGYPLEELKYTNSSELQTILESKTPSIQALRDRRIKSVFIWTRDGFWVQTGRHCDQVRDLMMESDSLDDVQDVRGLSASTGKAIGPAKIVKSATEIDKVEEGDVMIAVMTRPDYVAAMKKAAAIITNEGGITCHAAIVSRELDIPCLIGTKIATEVFQDGDMVEVNTNHGWARKAKI